jgi:hypothetical protein
MKTGEHENALSDIFVGNGWPHLYGEHKNKDGFRHAEVMLV